MEVGSINYNALSFTQKPNPIDQNPTELTEEEKKQVEELKKRDREVRQHEQAHKRRATGLKASGPHFEYTTGPDGRRYATGGHVDIDTSEVPNDPEATLKKAKQIRKAALAPTEPSQQDLRVANEAALMEAKAKIELHKEKREEDSDSEKTETQKNIESAFNPENSFSNFELII